MATFDPFPTLLLSISRNPVTAIGLPLAAGVLSGLPSRNVVPGQWYRVDMQFASFGDLFLLRVLRLS